MCDYVDLTQGRCRILNDVCPYIYFCTKTNSYKPNKEMPSDCSVKKKTLIPKGAYEVCYESHGSLYVDVNGYVEIVDNPFDYIPVYVNMTKLKNGKWKIKTKG